MEVQFSSSNFTLTKRRVGKRFCPPVGLLQWIQNIIPESVVELANCVVESVDLARISVWVWALRDQSLITGKGGGFKSSFTLTKGRWENVLVMLKGGRGQNVLM